MAPFGGFSGRARRSAREYPEISVIIIIIFKYKSAFYLECDLSIVRDRVKSILNWDIEISGSLDILQLMNYKDVTTNKKQK